MFGGSTSNARNSICNGANGVEKNQEIRYAMRLRFSYMLVLFRN